MNRLESQNYIVWYVAIPNILNHDMLYSSKRQGLRPPIMARKMKHAIAFPNYVSTVVCFLWICSIRFLTRLSRLGLHTTLPPATVQLSASRFCSPKPPHDPKENPPNSPEISSDNRGRNLQDPTDMRFTVTQTPVGVVRISTTPCMEVCAVQACNLNQTCSR